MSVITLQGMKRDGLQSALCGRISESGYPISLARVGSISARPTFLPPPSGWHDDARGPCGFFESPKEQSANPDNPEAMAIRKREVLSSHRPRDTVARRANAHGHKLTIMFASLGFVLAAVATGQQPMASTAGPDLIVSDLAMPYKDGFGVLRAVRTDPRLERVPVILLSMKDREEDIVGGLEMGADDYLVKPFNARELLSRIRKQLDRPDRKGAR